MSPLLCDNASWMTAVMVILSQRRSDVQISRSNAQCRTSTTRMDVNCIRPNAQSRHAAVKRLQLAGLTQLSKSCRRCVRSSGNAKPLLTASRAWQPAFERTRPVKEAAVNAMPWNGTGRTVTNLCVGANVDMELVLRQICVIAIKGGRDLPVRRQSVPSRA